MAESPAFQSPRSWTDPSFSLDAYDLIFLPGGHEKGVRQLIDSLIVQHQLATYFPKTRKPSTKTVAAVCHGVLALSEAKLPDGKSVMHDTMTTALPGAMEGFAFWGTRMFLGDYYKTYGKGSDSVETVVRRIVQKSS
jgi:putative intracellular protease/amidase